MYEYNKMVPRIIIGYSSKKRLVDLNSAINKCFDLCVTEYFEVIENDINSFEPIYHPSLERSNRATGLRSYYIEQVRQKNKRFIQKKPLFYNRLEKQVTDDSLGTLYAAMVRWSNLNSVKDMVFGQESNEAVQSIDKQTCQQFISSASSKLKDYENKIQFLISGNELVDFHPDVMPASFWKNLKMYSCSCNQLSKLELSGEDKETGEEITMPNLLELYASHNQIIEIDPSIGKLKNLRLLDLSANRLDSLPLEIFLLENLELLDVSLNKLVTIPSEIGSLKRLKTLNLSYNRIETLPFNLFLLENLEQLYLENNQLRKIPPTMASMKNLKTLALDNNPHLSNTIPIPVLKGNIEILKNYLEESNLKGEPCYRTKLMFVGQENVGKTSLFRCIERHSGMTITTSSPSIIQTVSSKALKGGNHQGTQISGKPLSTDGIDIHRVYFETDIETEDGKKEMKDMIFNLWDFGGQEVYYTTHSFFLTERSIFVIIFNLILGPENCRVEHWLNSIKTRSPNAPIFLVGTHLDSDKIKRSKAIQLMEDLHKKYKKTFKVRGSIALSCETNENVIEFIQNVLTVSKKEPYMGSMIPSSYFTLEDLFLMERRSKELQGLAPICTWKEIKEVARKSNFMNIQNINERDFDEKAYESQLSVAIDVLHLIGTIVRFTEVGGNLDKIVILDPQWLTKVFSTIITTKASFIKDGVIEVGILFEHVWREFPKKLHLLLLGLLENFEIAFRLPDDEKKKTGSNDTIRKLSKIDKSLGLINENVVNMKSRLLIPSLLPEDRPEFNLIWPDKDPDPSRTQFSRIYSFPFMPNGLFSRFIIRLLKFSDSLRYWRHGALIKSKKEDSSLSLIELNIETNKIYIHVRGESPAEFFRTIIELLDSLLHHWFKVTAKISAICPVCIRNGINPPTEFTKEECLESSARGSWFLQCNAEKDHDHLVKMEQIAPDIAMVDFEGKRIDFDREVTINEEIGKGAFGVVYKGIYNKEVVAIKKLLLNGKSEEETKDIYDEFRKEVWIMSGLQHPCIVNLKGFSLHPTMAMVMELLKEGDLNGYINNDKENNPLGWDLRLRIAWDIAKGLAFLHSTNPPLLHRDIKSPNILLASRDPKADVVAKIADFGLTGHIFTDKFAAQKAREREVVNPVWLAPEVMREQPYGTAADVYPYGIILWELYARDHPFDEFKYEFMTDLENAIKEGVRPTIPDDCPSDYADFIRLCWDSDPLKRPSFKTIVEELLPPLIDKYCPEIKESLKKIEEIERRSIAIRKEKDMKKDKEKKSWFNATYLAKAETSNETIVAMASSSKYVWCINHKGVLNVLNSETGKLFGKYENILLNPNKPVQGLFYDKSYKRFIITQNDSIISYKMNCVTNVSDKWKEMDACLYEIDVSSKKKGKIKRKYKTKSYLKIKEKIIYVYRNKDDKDNNKPEYEIQLDKCNLLRDDDDDIIFYLEFINTLNNDEREIIGFDDNTIDVDDSSVSIHDVYDKINFFIDSIKNRKCKLDRLELFKCDKDKQNESMVYIMNSFVMPDCIVAFLSDYNLLIIKGTKQSKMKLDFIDRYNDSIKNPKITFENVNDMLWLSYEMDIYIIDIENKRMVDCIKGHSATITIIKKLDDEVLSYSIDNQLKTWDFNGKLISTTKVHHYFNSILPVGKDLIVSQSNGLSLWDSDKKEKKKDFERRHEDPVTSMIIIDGDVKTVWTFSNVAVHIWK